MGGMGTMDYAKSLADPWNYSGCIPDGASGVGCATIKQTGTVSPGATGSVCGVYVSPTAGSLLALDTGNNSSTTTIPANWTDASAMGTYQSLFKGSRPISCGLRLTYIGPTTSDGGVILIGALAEGIALSVLSGGTLQSVSAILKYFKTVPLRNGAQVTWLPSDIDAASEFQNQSTGQSTGTARINDMLVAAVFGASGTASGVVQYELVLNFEGEFFNTTFSAGGAKSEMARPAEPNWYENARNIAKTYGPTLKAVFNAAAPYLLNGMPRMNRGFTRRSESGAFL